jgi:hypothetical protein
MSSMRSTTPISVLAGIATAGLLVLSGCADSDKSSSPPPSDSPAAGDTSSAAPSSSGPDSPSPSPAPSTPPSSSGSASSADPSSGPPSGAPAVVTLAAQFSRPSVTLTVGQQLTVNVSPTVKTTLKTGPSCQPGDAHAVLAQVCGSGSAATYVAHGSGTTQLSVIAKPNCKPGTMCPQWVTHPELTVVVR